jgi:hypothetical protein
MRVNKALKHLIYLFILIYPDTDAKTLYANWKRDKVLAEYNRPLLELLESWFIDVRESSETKQVTSH